MPSRDSWTSSSHQSAPSRAAAVNALSVFSGYSPLDPRWAIMSSAIDDRPHTRESTFPAAKPKRRMDFPIHSADARSRRCPIDGNIGGNIETELGIGGGYADKKRH